MAKRYYWLRLQHDFFDSVRIKKLRKLAGGDTFTIIYLKMQLLSLKTDGMLTYKEYEPSFAEELALDIDEDVENVAATLAYLERVGLIETSDNIEYFLPFVEENIGETNETNREQALESHRQRQKRYRERQKALKSIGCADGDVTVTSQRDVEIEKEIEKEKRESKSIKATPSHTVYFPDDALLEKTFHDFMEMRKKIKKPMTDRAIELMIGKIQKYPPEQAVELLEDSILHGWQDIYPHKEVAGKSGQRDMMREIWGDDYEGLMKGDVPT